MRIIKNIMVICLLFCIGIIGFTACEKYADDTPQAIKKLIRKTSKNGSLESVREYQCGKELVYLFCSYNIPDGISGVYDKEGNALCKMGGLDGANTCTEVCEYMMEIRVVWMNGK